LDREEGKRNCRETPPGVRDEERLCLGVYLERWGRKETKKSKKKRGKKRSEGRFLQGKHLLMRFWGGGKSLGRGKKFL